MPNEIAETLNDCWKGIETVHISPKIKSMYVDNMGAKSNVILSSGSKHHAVAEIQLTGPSDNVKFKWEIYSEDWYYPKGPPGERGLFADSTSSATDFTTPVKEGPYRIFITVINSKGYFATANIPIYVVR